MHEPTAAPLRSRDRPGQRFPLGRALVLAPLIGILAGCAELGYYTQSVGGHLDLLARSRSIEEVLADPSTPSSLALRLRAALGMRRFAVEQLSLPDNGSYRRYARLDRAAVVWAVAAAPELSVEPRQWCFPVAGCVSYRGYFRRDAAESFAAGLAADGWDVAIRPAAAYSTLGWLADPLPSTVIDWPRPRLAGLLFHELAHQRLYVPGDTAFNEAFASVVEAEGVRRWIAAYGEPGERQAWERLRLRQGQLADLMLGMRRRLEALYATDLPLSAKRRRKAALLEGIRDAYARLKASWDGYSGLDAALAGPVNNASLALAQAYDGWVPALQLLLERHGGRPSPFYEACERLARLPQPEREARLRALQASALAEAVPAALSGRDAPGTPAPPHPCPSPRCPAP
ncbi:MAG: aminopeptidase [Chromatiales bacterium]|jgi:predicted aminopeptidase